MGSFSVAVAGATGLVGRTILRVLEEQRFPVRRLVALASPRSAGQPVPFCGENIPVQELDERSFSDVDIAFFSAGASVSRVFAPIAARSAALVVDNSSAFRMHSEVPLIVPEVNGGVLFDAAEGYRGIVANPNCSTIQMVVALNPLHRRYGLESVTVATYQSVSGTGEKGMRALWHELETGQKDPASPYPHSIALNVLPHIDVFDADGWSGEERKMINETRKIFALPHLHVLPTTVRVPVRVSHSEAVYARFSSRVDASEARAVLAAAPGVVVQDDPSSAIYPLAAYAEGRDEVFVGRIRRDPDDDHTLALWVVSDNLRKGAATNAVQIAASAIPYLRKQTTYV